MQELIERLDTWLQANRPEYYIHLQPGLTEDELLALEQRLGVALPADFKTFYRWKNGQADEMEEDFFNNWSLMRADDIARTTEVMRNLVTTGAFDYANWWDARWVPFLKRYTGDNICLDMAGSFSGQSGQVLVYLHEDRSRPILHGSFTNWLETIVRAIETASVTLEPDGAYFDYKPLLDPGYPIEAQAG
jgi:cell wall assembly regulator SMI1